MVCLIGSSDINLEGIIANWYSSNGSEAIEIRANPEDSGAKFKFENYRIAGSKFTFKNQTKSLFSIGGSLHNPLVNIVFEDNQWIGVRTQDNIVANVDHISDWKILRDSFQNARVIKYLNPMLPNQTPEMRGVTYVAKP